MGQHNDLGVALFKMIPWQEAFLKPLGGGELMPTPKALDGVKGNLKTSQERLDSGHQVDLPNVVIDLVDSGGVLLPTTRRSMGNASQPEVDAGDPKKRIENTVLLGDINWGKFAPAIERWETVIERPAPAPTKPDGKDGSHRLSAEFTEFMMGLPAGWVTDPELGLSRNEQLKLCGNGVVPQQAALALRMMLTDVPISNAGGGQVMFPTPTVSDIYTDNLASTQQKPGSMHSVTLAQAAKWVTPKEEK